MHSRAVYVQVRITGTGSSVSWGTLSWRVGHGEPLARLKSLVHVPHDAHPDEFSQAFEEAQEAAHAQALSLRSWLK